ncbi:MAG: 3-deoxy-8-phosphooctulonate synthase [Elusimicrobiota bacterium]
MQHLIKILKIKIGNGCPLALIAGLCIMETEKETFEIAEKIITITTKLKIPFIFKASYDKANRSSISAYRGPGLTRGLAILAGIKKELNVPILTDVHSADEVERAAEVADILQIPAFLCRQTDLILACARTGKPINIKKGQFLSPPEMKNIVGKIVSTGNRKILLTERGSSFGYNNLVVDMRALAIMKKTGYPVIFDATHSVQLPGGLGTSSGGETEFVPILARAAAAVGIAGVFLEVHPDPKRALSDSTTQLNLKELPLLLTRLKAIDCLVKKFVH